MRRVGVAQELERCGCDSGTGNICVWLKDCRYVVWLRDSVDMWVWLRDCRYVGVARGLSRYVGVAQGL